LLSLREEVFLIVAHDSLTLLTTFLCGRSFPPLRRGVQLCPSK
jgi:hypothetical protein